MVGYQPCSYTIQTPENNIVVRNCRHIQPTATSPTEKEDTAMHSPSAGSNQDLIEEHHRQVKKPKKKVQFNIPVEDKDKYITRSGRMIKPPKTFQRRCGPWLSTE